MSDSHAWITASLQFLHECVASTPLRRQAELFAPDRVDDDDSLGACLLATRESFATDLARWSLDCDGDEVLFDQIRLAPNLQATFFYRLCRALHLAGVAHLPDVVAIVSRQLTAMEIYYSAEIGPGLKIIHGAGSVIGAGCTIGSHFTLYQGVTVGDKLGRQTGVRPVLGDRIIASAGCQVLGPVEVGSESVLGAGAVVLDSLPARCIAAGVPARVRVADLSDEQFGEFWDSIKG